MTTNFIGFIAAGIFILFSSCQNSKENNTKTSMSYAIKPLREKVFTAEEQKALTPESVLKRLKEGNVHFVNNTITARDHSAMVRNAVKGQYPKAVIISCIDSRIPVEDVFDKGIGDLFVGRVAGNFVNEDLLGSIEYGCKISGAKLIVILGHESCGAIKATIDDVKLGNITNMLNKIKPAVINSQNFEGEKTSKNDAFVELVAKNNIINTIETVKTKSHILKEMIDNGSIKIVGAYYNIKTGEVNFL